MNKNYCDISFEILNLIKCSLDGMNIARLQFTFTVTSMNNRPTKTNSKHYCQNIQVSLNL